MLDVIIVIREIQLFVEPLACRKELPREGFVDHGHLSLREQVFGGEGTSLKKVLPIYPKLLRSRKGNRRLPRLGVRDAARHVHLTVAITFLRHLKNTGNSAQAAL